MQTRPDPNDSSACLAYQINQRMERAGLTNAQLAALTGISVARIRKMRECDRSCRVTLRDMSRLAETFGIAVHRIVSASD